MNPLRLNLLIALGALRDGWRRNVLALAGVALGIGAVVAMIGLTLIVREEALRPFERSGLDVFALRKVSTPAASLPRRPPLIELSTVDHLAASVPALVLVAPLLERRGALAIDGRTSQGTVLGVTEAFSDLNGLHAAEGRLLTDLDREEPYVVVGRDQAAQLRAGSARPLVGRQLQIEGRVATIIGVLAPAQAIRLHAGDLNQAVMVPAGTFGRIFDAAEINVIYARHGPGIAPAEAIADSIAALQSRVEGLALQATSAAEWVAEMQRQLRLFTLLLGSTGILALVLGGIGIMNGLTLAVSERRHEIGLRRALGALQADIRTQFLIEALILCGAGGAIGAPAGALVTRLIAAHAGWAYALPAAVPAAGLALAVVVGAAAGFVPAFQAARLKPVVALRAA